MKSIILPDEVVMSKIYLIRNIKVMLDRDLAELFEVKAIRLREIIEQILKSRSLQSFSDRRSFSFGILFGEIPCPRFRLFSCIANRQELKWFNLQQL